MRTDSQFVLLYKENLYTEHTKYNSKSIHNINAAEDLDLITEAASPSLFLAEKQSLQRVYMQKKIYFFTICGDPPLLATNCLCLNRKKEP